jgi:hypothetical protein
MASSAIKKIEVFPLNLIFHFHKGGKTILRFGTTYTENIEHIKSGIEEFSSLNNITLEEIAEEI